MFHTGKQTNEHQHQNAARQTGRGKELITTQDKKKPPREFFKIKEVQEHATKKHLGFIATTRWYYSRKSKKFLPVYSPFKTYDEFLNWYRIKTRHGPSNGVCEYTGVDYAVKVVLDIDIKGLESEKIMREPIIRAVAQVKQRTVKLGLKDETWEPQYVVAIGSRWEEDGTFKYSAHVIFQDLSAASRPALLHFMEPVCSENETIDRSIYASKASQSFRFIDSYKWTDKSKTPLAPVRQWSTAKSSIHYDYLISNPDPSTVTIQECPQKTTKKRKRPDSTSSLVEDVVEPHKDYDGSDMVMAELIKKLPHNKIEYKSDKKIYYIYHHANETCEIAGRQHSSSNNSYAQVDELGNVWRVCFSDKCKKHRQFLFSTSLLQVRKGVGVWREGVDVDTKQPDANGKIKPFDLNWNQQCLVVVAGMSMGKTHQLKTYLDKTKPKRVLMITSRRSLATTLKGAFPQFEMYTDNINANWLICQYESTHRIQAPSPFDVVISDEVRSTCQNMTSVTTNGQFLSDNAAGLECYMKNARRTILLDADAEIDGMVSDVLHGIFRPRDIRVERYEGSTMKRNLEVIKTEDWWNELQTDARNGLKLGVPCRTKKDAQYIAAKTEELGLQFKLYTSHEDDSATKDFLDVNAAWESVHVVIFSSKLTVGVDCQLEFDRVYIHADAYRGCTAREIHQMQARFRNLKDITLRVAVKESRCTDFDTYEECLNYYDERRRAMDDAISGYVRFHPAFTKYGQIWAPDHVTSAFAHDRSEQSKNFVCDLFQQAADKGYKVFDRRFSQLTQDEKEKITQEVKELKTEVNANVANERENMYNELKDCYEEELGEADDKIRIQDGTRRDRMVCEMAAVLKHYTDVPEYKTYETMLKYRSQIKNIAAVMRTRCTEDLSTIRPLGLMEDELWQLEKRPWADLGNFKMFTQIYVELGCMTKLLGCTEIFDEEATISQETLIKHKDEIERRCKKISLLRGVKWRPSESKNDSQKIAGVLSKQLGAMFAVKLTRKQGWVGDRETRTRTSTYSLVKNSQVHELAQQSDYYAQGGWQTSPVTREGDMWNHTDGFVAAVEIPVA